MELDQRGRADAVQTYRGGQRDAWTGAPDAKKPASRLTLTAPVDE